MASTAMTSQQRIDPAMVNGWGIDADPRNDPTYPYRDRSKDDGPGMTWDRPPLQPPSVEILRSIEHNRLTAVFGTSVPPSGVSGMIRRTAFTYSESDWRHWLMLLGADRVDMVEGILDDLSQGRIPNIPAEMGIGSAWKHDRHRLVTGAVVTMSIAAVAAGLLLGRRKPHPSRRRRRRVVRRGRGARPGPAFRA